jgi:hypothetical protein
MFSLKYRSSFNFCIFGSNSYFTFFYPSNNFNITFSTFNPNGSSFLFCISCCKIKSVKYNMNVGKSC